jgi:hypothetical protein
MTFPVVLGSTPCGDGDHRAEVHELARRLEGEGAYSRDPDSVHDRELLAEAEIAALPVQRMCAVDANLLVDHSEELLAAWEDALDIPSNAARDTAERRTRATAYASLPWAASLVGTNELLDLLGLGGLRNILGTTWTAFAGAGVSTGEVDPFGGTEGVLVSDSQAGASSGAFIETVLYQRGAPIVGAVWVKKDATADHFVLFQVDDETGASVAEFDIDVRDGRSNALGSVVSVSVVEAVSGWWYLTFEVAPQETDGLAFVFRPAAGEQPSFPLRSVTAQDGFVVFGATIAGSAIMRSSRARVIQENASPETILQSVVLVTDEQYETPAFARNVDILTRLLPTRALGSWTREGALEEMLVTNIAPEWGGASKLGRSALGSKSPSQRAHVRPPARFRDYGPYSRLTAEDLNAIQDAQLFRRDDQETWTNAIQDGIAQRFFDFTVNATLTGTIDSSIDWRERFILVAIRYNNTAATDIRPGQAGQGNFNGNTFAALGYVHLYSGTGGAGSYRKLIPGSGIYVEIDAATGALKLNNTNLATATGAGIVIATGHLGGHSAAPASKRQTFAEGDAMPAASWYAGLRGETFTAKCNGAAVSAFASQAGADGVHRIGALPYIERPIAGTNTLILDRSMDWRDRLAVIFAALVWPSTGSGFDSGFDSGFGAPLGAGLGPAWPGAGETSFGETPGIKVWYSGPGNTSGATWGVLLDAGTRIYARDTDGALMVDVLSTAPQKAYAIVLQIHASERLGVHSSPIAVPNPAPSGGDAIYPYELNALQDATLLAQLSEGDWLIPLFHVQLDLPASMPLGPLLTGPKPYLPASFTTRARWGLIPEVSYHRRQRIAGGELHLCTVAGTGNGTDLLIDASIDWRDRFLFAIGTVKNADPSPGEAGDTAYNNGTDDFAACAYTHDGHPNGAKSSLDHAISAKAGAQLVIYVGDDSADTPGGLYLRNDNGGTRYVGMQVFASPQLGPRSKRHE